MYSRSPIIDPIICTSVAVFSFGLNTISFRYRTDIAKKDANDPKRFQKRYFRLKKASKRKGFKKTRKAIVIIPYTAPDEPITLF